MRRSFFVAAIAALMLILAVAPAAATPPTDVEFEVETSFGTGGGPFTASGPAVDAGLMCPEGETTLEFWMIVGFKSSPGMNFQVIKKFACDDGSGDFLVKLQVRSDRKGVNFNWMILGGTGAYSSFHGSGQGVGIGIDEGILDLYAGAVHND